MITRRQAIKTTALASVAFATLPGAIAQTNSPAPAAAPSGPFTLPPLPYAYDALEPHIDAQTMQIHHDKHHATYVANLNKAVAEFPELGKKSVEDLLKDLYPVPEKIGVAVRNNGGGHYNHSLFWQMMKKNGGGTPSGELAKDIDAAFLNYNAFKDSFTKAALGQFGSGWVWLVIDSKTKSLQIMPSANQDTLISNNYANMSVHTNASLNGGGVFSEPIAGETHKKIPLLGLDVWEHAYYLKYQNKRADYIAAWFNVVNWDFVSERYAKL
jgi:Fe-Mn family superoxide dismutase